MNIPSLIILHCADIGASRDFYEIFGLSFEHQTKADGTTIYINNDPRVVFELIPSDNPSSGSMTGLGFRSNDLDGLIATLREKGFAPAEPVRHEYGHTFEVADPDGRIVEVLQEAFSVEI